MGAVKMAEPSGGCVDKAQPLPPRDEIAAHHLIDETRLLDRLLERAVFSEDERRRSADIARRLVHSARASHEQACRRRRLHARVRAVERGGRHPDVHRGGAACASPTARPRTSSSPRRSPAAIGSATSGTPTACSSMLRPGRCCSPAASSSSRSARGANPLDAIKRLVARSGEPVIRQAVRQAVKVLGDQFVLGRTIKEALVRAQSYEDKGYLFSYDMLGEGARTQKDADAYFERYMAAIDAIGKAAGPFATMHVDALYRRPGMSVKLSALHPRFEPGKEQRLDEELTPRLLSLARAARSRGLSLTIDAEEQDRLDPTLHHFAALFTDPALDGWNGLGLAVQAYGKRAVPVLRWLRRLSERTGKRIPVRLVKGAYWDSEIKWAQERALADYPVFTRKLNTDVSYLACVRLLLSDPKAFYPQFATHNAHALAAAHVAGGPAVFEFQRLHGMGEALYEGVIGDGGIGRPCRIYAPVGGHEELLAYLVRRLLENGANTSFVNRLADDEAPVAEIIRDPVEIAERERAANAAPARVIPASARDLSAAQVRSGPGADRGRRAHRAARRDVGGARRDLRGRPDHRRADDGRRQLGEPAHLPARPARAHRHGAHHDAGAGRHRHRKRHQGAARLERSGRHGARADSRSGGRSLRARPRQAHGRDRARGRQDARGRAGRRARGCRLPALLRERGAPSVRRTGAAPGPHGRAQHADAQRPRRVRLHLAVELPACDLHRPGRGRTCRRQCGAGQARRADADHRLPGDAPPARGGSAERRPPPPHGERPARRGAHQGRTRARASPSPARTRRPGSSSGRWRNAARRSCPSSPRPAASMP